MTFFKLEGRLTRFNFPNQELVWTIAQPFPASVGLRSPNDDELVDNETLPNARCWVIAEIDATQDFLDILGPELRAMPLHHFQRPPKNVQNWVIALREKFSDVAAMVIQTVRWRGGEIEPSVALYDTNFAYSFDGEHWAEIGPQWVLGGGSANIRRGYGEEARTRYQEMFDAGDTDPIAHDLLREAWALRKQSPRSAHIVGVAAIEVGLKACLSRLMPDGEWIFDNVPSPPVDDIIRNFFPEYLSSRGNLSLFMVPRPCIAKVKDAIKHRNTLAHRLPGTPRYAEANAATNYLVLVETLATIRDILYLLDVYTGHPWAIDKLRPATRQLLINRNDHRALPEPTYDRT